MTLKERSSCSHLKSWNRLLVRDCSAPTPSSGTTLLKIYTSLIFLHIHLTIWTNKIGYLNRYIQIFISTISYIYIYTLLKTYTLSTLSTLSMSIAFKHKQRSCWAHHSYFFPFFYSIFASTFAPSIWKRVSNKTSTFIKVIWSLPTCTQLSSQMKRSVHFKTRMECDDTKCFNTLAPPNWVKKSSFSNIMLAIFYIFFDNLHRTPI